MLEKMPRTVWKGKYSIIALATSNLRQIQQFDCCTYERFRVYRVQLYTGFNINPASLWLFKRSQQWMKIANKQRDEELRSLDSSLYECHMLVLRIKWELAIVIAFAIIYGYSLRGSTLKSLSKVKSYNSYQWYSWHARSSWYLSFLELAEKCLLPHLMCQPQQYW